MGEVDPRWLEILKASGWQLFAISLALLSFQLLLYFKILPPIDSVWIIYGLPLAILVTGSLALGAALERAVKIFGDWWKRQRIIKQTEERRISDFVRFSEYVPHLTEIEFRILAYLYQNDQKTFMADITGDLASTLYNQGFIELVAKPGQRIGVLTATFRVSDVVWEVMVNNHEHFSNPKIKTGYRDKLPWHSVY